MLARHWPLGWPWEDLWAANSLARKSLREFCMSPTFAFSIVRPASITNRLEAHPLCRCTRVGYVRGRPHSGADFLDIQGEFSERHTRLRFMMAGTAELEVAFRRHGVANDSRVVLYSLGSPMWATRFWWMLKSLGFSRASVLDGGFEKWSAEGRAIERGSPEAIRPVISRLSRPDFFVDKHGVLAARTIRALSSSTRLAPNSTRVLNRAATAGPVAFREASMFPRRHCMTPPPRNSQMRPMRSASSRRGRDQGQTGHRILWGRHFSDD